MPTLTLLLLGLSAPSFAQAANNSCQCVLPYHNVCISSCQAFRGAL